MESSRSKNDDNLGVNRTGKKIRKSHLHENNFHASLPYRRRHHSDYIYTISKEELKDFAQFHTGLHSHDHSTRPIYNHPERQNMRLNTIRPPPLLHVQRPPMLEAPSLAPYNNDVTLQRSPPSIHTSSSLVPNIPSTETNDPPILPSSTFEFILPSSPTAYMNLESPKFYYPPPSPGMKFPSESCTLEPLLFPEYPPSPTEIPDIASPRRGDQ